MDTSNIKANTIFIAKESLANPQTQQLKPVADTDKQRQNQELSLPVSSEKLIAGNPAVFEQADSFKQKTVFNESADALGFKVRQELEAYQSIDKQKQREDISKLLGVDIFA